MTTGISLELVLARASGERETHTLDFGRGAVRDLTLRTALRPSDVLSLGRAPGAVERPRIRVLVGARVVAVLDPRLDRFDVPLDFVEGLEGEEPWRLEIELGGLWVPAARLQVELESASHFQGLRAALKDAVMGWAPALAVDELADLERSNARRATSLASRLDRLRTLMSRLQALLPALRAVARSSQKRERERRDWRPGMVAWRVSPLGYERVQRPDGSTVVRPTTVAASRAVPTWDLEEHRQLRRALRAFHGRAERLAREAAEAREAVRAGLSSGERARALSPDEKSMALARIERMTELERLAKTLARSVRSLESEEPWISGASVARTELKPTPAFRRVEEYRALYRWLEEYRELERGDEVGVLDRFKRTEDLFELWVFGAVLAWAERRFPSAVGLVDRMDEIRRGDVLELDDGEGGALRLVLEPVIPPLRHIVGDASSPYRASLSSGPLRPDVWFERVRAGEPRDRTRAAVLDAKCTDRFASRVYGRSMGDELEKIRDYRNRVVEPRSGHQPVRAVFQVHPVATARPLCNVPQFLDADAPRDGYLSGAVGSRPGDTAELERVLDRLFLWL